ncbi:hypothetical protein WJX72_006019 [[Myrmecia] bisecta]|uniref:Uncharacterized protein n=1 Tax=[Myrmecia] bisecta TaxID=41462 RepID=A0AAW1PYJ0_9CHLO
MSLIDKVLHKTKSKSPHDVVAKTVHSLERLTSSPTDKQNEDLAKYLSQMKLALFGENDQDPNREMAVMLVYEACKTELPYLLVQKLALLEFEARKDAAAVVGGIIRMDTQGDAPGVRFVHEHPDMLNILFSGYENPAVALNCGTMLRDCCRDESLARMVLEGPLFNQYFEKVEVSNFEVASDAFSTFKDLLTRHKPLVANYLNTHYDSFFSSYTKLLQSENYVTRRQSLKLLGELLLDRSNVKIMMRYVSDTNNLKLMMILLKGTSRSIQFEAFHVFKVFVANPNKTPGIVDILTGNKEKLLKYLADFHTDKDDEDFQAEKAEIVRALADLEPSRSAASKPPAAAVRF